MDYITAQITGLDHDADGSGFSARAMRRSTPNKEY
jgi:hypothetical protein